MRHHDSILVNQCLEGDARAWREVTALLRDLAYKGWRGRAPWTEQDIEDLVQLTCEQLLKDDQRLLRVYDPDRARLRTYLAGILTKKAMHYARKHFCREMLVPDPFGPDSKEAWHDVDALTFWSAAERLLTHEDLLILRLSKQGYRSEEIADILTRLNQSPVTPARVRKRKQRAMERIRSHVHEKKSPIRVTKRAEEGNRS